MAGELSRLEQTSEQVLASARLEQSHEAPVLEPLELNSVVQGIVGRARAGLEARGATLKVTYNPDPLPVSLDISAFSVVLNNLLDNAVKYSNGANQPVTVRLQSQGDLVLMQVTDEGIGIADKDKTHVFERFYRVGSEMTRQSKGVGLGPLPGQVDYRGDERLGQGRAECSQGYALYRRVAQARCARQ